MSTKFSGTLSKTYEEVRMVIENITEKRNSMHNALYSLNMHMIIILEFTSKLHFRFYWEVQVFYRIHVTLLRNALLFEIGIARLDAIHSSFYVGSQPFAWSFSAERCNDHKQVPYI